MCVGDWSRCPDELAARGLGEVGGREDATGVNQGRGAGGSDGGNCGLAISSGSHPRRVVHIHCCCEGLSVQRDEGDWRTGGLELRGWWANSLAVPNSRAPDGRAWMGHIRPANAVSRGCHRCTPLRPLPPSDSWLGWSLRVGVVVLTIAAAVTVAGAGAEVASADRRGLWATVALSWPFAFSAGRTCDWASSLTVNAQDAAWAGLAGQEVHRAGSRAESEAGHCPCRSRVEQPLERAA